MQRRFAHRQVVPAARRQLGIPALTSLMRAYRVNQETNMHGWRFAAFLVGVIACGAGLVYGALLISSCGMGAVVMWAIGVENPEAVGRPA